jgi:hypothetical protein
MVSIKSDIKLNWEVEEEKWRIEGTWKRERNKEIQRRSENVGKKDRQTGWNREGKKEKKEKVEEKEKEKEKEKEIIMIIPTPRKKENATLSIMTLLLCRMSAC